MGSTTTKPNKFSATVEDGVSCVKEWQRGDSRKLEEWERKYLTAAGAEVMKGVQRSMTEAHVRRLVTKAVGA